MSKAREHILQRLRMSGATAAEAQQPSASTAMTSSQEKMSAALEQMLEANRIELVKGHDSFKALVEQLAQKGLKHWLLGTSDAVKTLSETISQIEGTELSYFDRNFEKLRDTLFDQVDIGVCSASAAIAETGTLVVRPNTQEPRTLSLVPPVNLIVVDTQQVFDTLASYLASLPEDALLETSNTLFISSPSKTADIQQKLAYGAHGPKRVIALMV